MGLCVAGAATLYPSDRAFVISFCGSSPFGLVYDLCILTAFFTVYSDWILGSLADDLIGVSSRGVLPLYIAYLVAKRLAKIHVRRAGESNK